MKFYRTILIILLVTFGVMTNIGSGGGGGGDDPTGPGGKYTYVLWLNAVKDAHVYQKMPEYNIDGAFSLVSSFGEPNGPTRIYIDFFMPNFPPGTKVLQAYINVWEDSRQVPGNGTLPVGLAMDEWSPYDITWLEQPNPMGPLSIATSIGAFIDYNMWRTTGDVAMHVQDQIDNPANNFGWILNHDSVFAYTRSFASLNALRDPTDLGFAPRLLIAVETTEPLTIESLGENLPEDNELGTTFGFGIDIQLYLIQSGSSFPESWEIGTM